MTHSHLRTFGIFVSLLLLLAGLPAFAQAEPVEVELTGEVEGLLLAAGNAHTDQERLDILKQVQEMEGLPPAFRTDLDSMIQYVNLWANGYEVYHSDNYLSRILRMSVARKYAPNNTKGTALDSMWRYYGSLTRLLGIIQTYGGFSRNSEETQMRVYQGILKNFNRASREFPKNEIMAMLMGTPLPWPAELEIVEDPEAPEWANLQRISLEKLKQVMEWWIVNRQKPEGFFGSGWGDDVEMWRSFTPLTVAFDSPILAESQAKLSNAIFAQDHMSSGFTSVFTDVEHAAEDSSDTITPMLVMAPNDPVWKERTMHIFDLAKSKWSGVNDRGQLQFKSTFLNKDRIDEDPAQATDTFYHCRLMQPAFLLWQWYGEEEVGAFVTEWMKTWVSTSMRSEKGKPAGVIPSTIEWPSAKPGGVSSDQWWHPGNWKTGLYDWNKNGNVSMMANTMLLCYLQTDDEFFLQPLKAMAEQREAYLAGEFGDQETPGGLAWSAARSAKIIMPALTKYRLVTGDTQFDSLLKEDASGYMKMRLTGDRSAMLEELRQNAKAFSVNFPVYTSLCRAGDRVFVMPERYFNRVDEVTSMSVPNLDVLYAMATGDPVTALYCPVNAVRWMTPPEEIAALVTEGNESVFEAELYHFGEDSRSMAASLLRLKPGKYKAVLRTSGEEEVVLDEQVIQIEGPGSQLPLTLPTRQLCLLSIQPIHE